MRKRGAQNRSTSKRTCPARTRGGPRRGRSRRRAKGREAPRDPPSLRARDPRGGAGPIRNGTRGAKTAYSARDPSRTRARPIASARTRCPAPVVPAVKKPMRTSSSLPRPAPRRLVPRARARGIVGAVFGERERAKCVFESSRRAPRSRAPVPCPPAPRAACRPPTRSVSGVDASFGEDSAQPPAPRSGRGLQRAARRRRPRRHPASRLRAASRRHPRTRRHGCRRRCDLRARRRASLSASSSRRTSRPDLRSPSATASTTAGSSPTP